MYEEACEHYEGLTEEQQSIWFSYSLSRMGEVKRGDGAVLSVSAATMYSRAGRTAPTRTMV